MISRISILCSTLVLFLGCLDPSASAQGIQLVSAIDPSQGAPAGGNGDSYLPIISPDGRFVLFASTANNLVALASGLPIPQLIPPPLNVFLRNRSNSTTTLVSVNSSGTGGADANATPVAISTDGRFALFESAADNLVGGDTNNASDVFLRDLVLGKTLLVSGSSTGGVANGASQWSVMTPDGHYVAFLSDATNLVANDTNGIPDVFVRDMQTGLIVLVSVGASGASSLPDLGLENPPAITPDGRFVVFHSTATNLVAGITTPDAIYVRDLQLGQTTQASAGALEAMQKVMGTSDVSTFNYAISSNGQYVVYEASSSFSTAGLLLRYHLDSGLTDLVHTNTAGNDQGIGSVDISPDGEIIAFVANTNGNSGSTTCVLVWNSLTATSELASGDLNGGVTNGVLCFWPTLDAKGRFVAFLSSGTGLVTNDLAGEFHLYVRDLQTRTTSLVDQYVGGAGSLLTSLPAASLSADGRFVAFETSDDNLVAGDRNQAFDVFVRDLLAARTELVSARDPDMASLTPDGDSSLSDFSVSADGLRVAFWSEADNLVDNDLNGLRDVFVRDLAANQTILISISTNGSAGDGLSTDPALSAEGRYVAFSSYADNLVPGDSNNNLDVFVRDLQTGVTSLVSVNQAGTSSGNGGSGSPVISSDGRFVLFQSYASDLVAGVGGGNLSENLYLRDRQLGTNYALSQNRLLASAMTPDGRFIAFCAWRSTVPTIPYLYVWDSVSASLVYTNLTPGISGVAISPDGQRLLYWGSSGGLSAVDRLANTNWTVTTNPPSSLGYTPKFSSDGKFVAYTVAIGTTNQIYLYDFQTGTNLLVSHEWSSSGPGNANSDSLDISSDGRFIAYRSHADNLVPGDSNGLPDIFLFDRVSGITTLISVNRSGTAPGDNRSLLPLFSGDGRTLFFVSLASDLVIGDFNNASDVFEFSLNSTQPVAPFRATASLDNSGSQIHWPALPGKSYRVQFKNDLNDAVWQDLPGNVAILGNTAYYGDPAAGATRRFYRIMAW
jgi:Tol biopolymer transport system component